MTFCAPDQPEPPPAPPPSASASAPVDAGWAQAASIVGFVFSAVELGLGVPAEITRSDRNNSPLPEAPLGISAFTVVGIITPVVAAGAGSAREGAVEGCLGCRIAGWVCYGLSMADFVATIASTVAGEGAPPPAIMIAGVGVGTVSTLLMSIDALMSHDEAMSPVEPQGAFTPTVAPIVAPVWDQAGLQGGLLGIGGTM